MLDVFQSFFHTRQLTKVEDGTRYKLIQSHSHTRCLLWEQEDFKGKFYNKEERKILDKYLHPSQTHSVPVHSLSHSLSLPSQAGVAGLNGVIVRANVMAYSNAIDAV